MAIDGVNDNPFAFLNANVAKEEKRDAGSLAMEDFLSLMTTQLKNQDPLKPMESGDFLGQIAAFGTVSGISDLQNAFNGFAQSMQSEQALQGSALVGRSVLVPSATGSLSADSGLKGRIDVFSPVNDLKVQLFNTSGQLVKTIDVGQAAGSTDFIWDGIDDNGDSLPAGVYQLRASATVNGANTLFSTATVAKVESVLVGSGNQGLTMNLAGLGSVPFSEAQEII